MGKVTSSLYVNSQFGACPACKTTGVLQRSHAKNMLEQIIRKITLFKPYRCKECGWRGFKFTISFSKNFFHRILYYVLLMLIAALIARYFIINYALDK
jgi:hypothetical protein